jgi:hypothetical protein
MTGTHILAIQNSSIAAQCAAACTCALCIQAQRPCEHSHTWQVPEYSANQQRLGTVIANLQPQQMQTRAKENCGSASSNIEYSQG